MEKRVYVAIIGDLEKEKKLVLSLVSSSNEGLFYFEDGLEIEVGSNVFKIFGHKFIIEIDMFNKAFLTSSAPIKRYFAPHYELLIFVFDIYDEKSLASFQEWFSEITKYRNNKDLAITFLGLENNKKYPQENTKTISENDVKNLIEKLQIKTDKVFWLRIPIEKPGTIMTELYSIIRTLLKEKFLKKYINTIKYQLDKAVEYYKDEFFSLFPQGDFLKKLVYSIENGKIKVEGKLNQYYFLFENNYESALYNVKIIDVETNLEYPFTSKEIKKLVSRSFPSDYLPIDIPYEVAELFKIIYTFINDEEIVHRKFNKIKKLKEYWRNNFECFLKDIFYYADSQIQVTKSNEILIEGTFGLYRIIKEKLVGGEQYSIYYKKRYYLSEEINLEEISPTYIIKNTILNEKFGLEEIIFHEDHAFVLNMVDKLVNDEDTIINESWLRDFAKLLILSKGIFAKKPLEVYKMLFSQFKEIKKIITKSGITLEVGDRKVKIISDEYLNLKALLNNNIEIDVRDFHLEISNDSITIKDTEFNKKFDVENFKVFYKIAELFNLINIFRLTNEEIAVTDFLSDELKLLLITNGEWFDKKDELIPCLFSQYQDKIRIDDEKTLWIINNYSTYRISYYVYHDYKYKIEIYEGEQDSPLSSHLVEELFLSRNPKEIVFKDTCFNKTYRIKELILKGDNPLISIIHKLISEKNFLSEMS